MEAFIPNLTGRFISLVWVWIITCFTNFVTSREAHDKTGRVIKELDRNNRELDQNSFGAKNNSLIQLDFLIM